MNTAMRMIGVVALALARALTRAVAQESAPTFYKVPTYPKAARLARIAGTVILGFTVDAAGTPSAIQVVSGHPLLAACARENLSTWKFSIPAEIAWLAIGA